MHNSEVNKRNICPRFSSKIDLKRCWSTDAPNTSATTWRTPWPKTGWTGLLRVRSWCSRLSRTWGTSMRTSCMRSAGFGPFSKLFCTNLRLHEKAYWDLHCRMESGIEQWVHGGRINAVAFEVSNEIKISRRILKKSEQALTPFNMSGGRQSLASWNRPLWSKGWQQVHSQHQGRTSFSKQLFVWYWLVIQKASIFCILQLFLNNKCLLQDQLIQ